ncbi:hypothetical protein ACFP2T_29140 [Plantactinospora solaniradicis]|uniref:DUF2946 domain-containing protein n=1 Tax=Plantactinospora solaniradicis TaxID=1723736 RepID=A0ABW1KG36_9ACTN
MTVAAGRAPSVLLLRWLTVVGALFAVALFGGPSCGDTPLAAVPMAGHAACPNVLLQASLPGTLVPEAGGGAPHGGHDPSDVVAGACLFVVVALAGLAIAGAVRRPLLVHASYWWARMGIPRVRPPSAGPTRIDVLRI